MDQIAELLVDFPVKLEVPVAWGDMDAIEDVNLIEDHCDGLIRAHLLS